MPLKEGKRLHWCPRHLQPSCTSARKGWCSSPSTPPVCSLLPIRRCWAQAWAPPRCSTAGQVLCTGPGLRGQVLCFGGTPRCCRPRRCSPSHGDARPVTGMLIPCTPTLCSQWSPARWGAGNVGKVFEKRVTAPQATGVAPGRTRTAESVSYKAPKMQTWFNKSPPPPQPCKTPAVKSGSALQQAH